MSGPSRTRRGIEPHGGSKARLLERRRERDYGAAGPPRTGYAFTTAAHCSMISGR